MPYLDYSDGIYLAVQPAIKGGLTHYGVLDIGDGLRVPGADGINPVIVHQRPPRIRADWLYDTGSWQLLAAATDPLAALRRYEAALTVPDYYALQHNCEHFARFVVTGTWESKQLQVIGWVTGIATFAMVAANDKSPRPRHRV